MNLQVLKEKARLKPGFHGSYSDALRYCELRYTEAYGKVMGEICKRAYKEQYPAERQNKDSLREALIEFRISLVRIAIATHINVDEIAKEIESCIPKSVGIEEIEEELQEGLKNLSGKGGLIDRSKVLGQIPEKELKDTIGVLLKRTKQIEKILGIELLPNGRESVGEER